MADNTVATNASGQAVSTPFPSVSTTYRGDAGRQHIPTSLALVGADDGDTTLQDVLPTRPLPVQEGPIASVTTSVVSTSTGSATLAAANANRRQLLIWNNSSAVLYVRLAAAAAAAGSATLAIDPQTVWKCPFLYTGEVRGILATGSGSAHVTE